MSDSFKEKFINEIEFLKSSKEGYEKDIENYKLELISYNEIKKAFTSKEMSSVINSNPLLDDSINDMIIKNDKIIEKTNIMIKQCQDRLETTVKRFQYLANNLCPHPKEYKIFDHVDYHKNEEYYLCQLCGSMI
jgi:hypothetical protein